MKISNWLKLFRETRKHSAKRRIDRRRRKSTSTQIAAENLEKRLLLTTLTWDGGGLDANWTTPENWVGDAAPVANDELVFPLASAQNSNVNDFAAGTSFGPILIQGSNYNLGGNDIVLNGPLTNTGSGNTFDIDVELGSSVGFASSSTLTVLGDIDTAGHTLSLESNSTSVYSGVISGSGSVETQGNGITALAGANTFSGTTTVAAGSLELRHDDALGVADGTVATGTLVTGSQATIRMVDRVSVGDELLTSTTDFFIRTIGASTSTWDGDIDAGGHLYPYGRLELNGNVDVGNNWIQVNSSSAHVVFSSSGSLTNVDLLRAANGITEVNTSTVLGRSPDIWTNGTLAGDGVLDWGGSANIQGTIDPGAGASTGVLTTGSMRFQSTAALNVHLDGLTPGTEHDQLSVNGTVQLNGALNVTLGSSFATIGDTITIISNDGTDAITGTFNGLSEGGLLSIGTDFFQISYQGGSNNNDVVLTKVSAGVWDGGGSDDNWTTAENWVGDVAPVAGANLIFATGASQTANVNDFASGTGFASVVIEGSNYSLSGNDIVLNGPVANTGSGNVFDIDVELGSSVGFASSSTLTVSGDIDTAGHTLSLESNSTSVYSGVISGSGSVETQGNGITALAGANTFSGTTTVAAGSLELRHDDALGVADGTVATGTLVTGRHANIRMVDDVSVGDELLTSTTDFFIRTIGTSTGTWNGDIDAGGNLYPYGILELNGDVDVGNNWVQVNSNGAHVVFGSSGSLTNVGLLRAANGITEINTSTVLGRSLDVWTNGTLAGDGVLDWGGSANIQGTIDPGAGTATGVLTTGSMNFQSTAALNVHLDGLTAGTEHDQLSVNGTVQLNGALNVTLGSSFATIGDTITIISNDGTDAISGSFSGLPEGGLVEFGGNIFTVSYVGGDGNDVSLTLQTGNSFPEGDPQTVVTDEDNSVNITLTGSDAEGDGFTFSIATQPEHGTLSGSGANLTYTPGLNFSGTDSFDFRVTSDIGGSTTATVTINVNEVQDPSTQVNLSNSSVVENSPIGTVVGALSTVDPDQGDTFTYTLVAGAGDVDNGLFSIDGNELKLAFRPDYETQTSHSVRIRSTDAGNNTVERAFTITVIDVFDPNAAPDAVNDSYVTDEDTLFSPSSAAATGGSGGSVLDNDTDADGDALTVTALNGDSGSIGQATALASGATITLNADGTFEYDPTTSATLNALAAGESTTDSFDYTIDDGNGETDSATVTITVNGVNDAPTLKRPRDVTVDEGETATNRGIWSDPDTSDVVTLAASVGSVTQNANGTWDWSFDTSDGPDDSQTVTITATDNHGVSTTTAFDLTVNNVAPSVTVNTSTVTVDEGQTATMSGTWSDPGNDVVTVAASVGTVTTNADGTWEWSYFAADGRAKIPVTITATDGDAASGGGAGGAGGARSARRAGGAASTTPSSSSAEFVLFINNVDPAFEAGPNETLLPPVVGSFTRSGIVISDPGDPETFTGTVDWGDGGPLETLAINQATRKFDLNHVYAADGTYTVTVTVDDGDQGVHTDSFDLTVILNTPPVANNDSVSTDEDSAATFNVLANDTDEQNNIVASKTVALTSPSAGVLTDNGNGNGSFTFNPNGAFESLAVNESAQVNFDYRIEDAFGETDTGTVTITVNGANDAPSVTNGGDVTVDEGGTASNSGEWSDVDASDVITLSASIGSIQKNANGSWDWSWDTSDGPDESRSVVITASDGNGGVTTTSFDLTVNNVAPSVVSLASSNADLANKSDDGNVAISGSLADPGVDTHTVHVNWGDGTSENVAVDQVADTFGGSHDYANGGIYTITVSVTDSDGAVSAAQTTTAVITGVGLVDGTLFVIGTNARDHISIRQHPRRDQIKVDAKLGNGDRHRRGNHGRHGGAEHVRATFAASDVDNIVVHACDGDDHVHLGGGSDGGSDGDMDIDASIFGGAGDDHLTGSLGNDYIDGGAGKDKISGRRGDDVLVDLIGDNRIDGGFGNDLITTGDGDDRIRGNHGNDVINAGDGRNDVDGGHGDDVIITGAGRDKVNGNHGDDVILSGDGDDRVSGGHGNDVISAGAGRDRVDGNHGDDVLIGGTGEDDVRGGHGDDLIVGGSTANEEDAASLQAALDAWVGNDLSAALLGLGTAFDDGDRDYLRGDRGRDHIIAGAGDRSRS